ncbi:DeoR/GlpR family DNA-binding transcription regulator [Streptomyces longwoodensis]|uniref:DeoR/GlpR family DNA-binding transcription regulator n=1 Tax=Streptomyces longwoodensis TaxID=68231 RepID=UPI0033DD17F4
MQAQERHEAILEVLLVEGRVEIAALRERLGVSEMTIRRDLAALERDGALRRVHGGASRVLSGSYEPPFAVRSRLHQGAKAAVAQLAGEQISDGETLIVDGGSTGLALAAVLGGRVVTACPLSLRVANALSASPTVRMLLPGGFVRPDEQSFVGEPVIRSLGDHVFDTYLMTISGATPAAGLTEWNSDDAAVKRAAMANAKRAILVCDSSKFGEAAFTKIAPLSAPGIVVTDTGLPQDVHSWLTDAGVTVLVADAAPLPPASGSEPERA